MFAVKYLLFALLALSAAELAVFILVGHQIGFVWALALVVASSLAGAMVLRHAGGSHIARARVVLGPQRMTALQAGAGGLLILLAGFLLLVPGFITDAAGLMLLVGPLRRWLTASVRRAAQRNALASSTWSRRTGARFRRQNSPTGADRTTKTDLPQPCSPPSSMLANRGFTQETS
jgi:UPF0716 protein FxsA